MGFFDHVNAASLEAGLGTMLVHDLAPFVSAEAEDVRDFGLAIAADFTRAILAGDKELTAELKGQIKLLAEISRIRLQVVDWKLTQDVLAIVFKAAALGVGAALPIPH